MADITTGAPLAGYVRTKLPVGRLMWNTAGPTTDMVTRADNYSGDIALLGRITIHVSAAVRNYQYSILYRVAASKLLVTPTGDLMLDIPDYVNAKGDVLAVMVPTGTDNDTLLAGLPTDTAV